MPSKQKKPLVLVADDEEAAATMLKHVFEREGYRVEIAGDGNQALQIASTQIPDLILLDIQMPRMDGFEVLRRLREKTQTATIPTIVVSARARKPSDVAHGLNIGADDYISKPFAPQELLARARSKMRARQLEETLQQRTQELEILLRISEELNRHLEIDELFPLVLYLVQDLLPAEMSLIGEFNEGGEILKYHHVEKGVDVEDITIDTSIAETIQRLDDDSVWDSLDPQLGFQHGLAMHLRHGGNLLGVIVAASNVNSFTDNHRLLFRGIARQTSLALQNARLFEIQANYAQHLEEMVAQRTHELQETQQLLFRSEKLASIGHLAASIAHEINNPLQPIQLNLEYLLEDIQAGNEVDAELVTMTQDSVGRIRRIVRQLLEFTKSSGDKILEQISLIETAEAVLKLNDRNLACSGITVIRHYDDQIPIIEASRDQIEQVIMNIVLNAQAAMDDGGELTLRISTEAEWVTLEIQDTGPGVPDHIIDSVFDPFVSTKPEGSGLGLFVTYGIIERHKGNIVVKNTLDGGAVFTIVLPRSQSSASSSYNDPA